jgi:hypothetical protein
VWASRVVGTVVIFDVMKVAGKRAGMSQQAAL